MLIDGRNGSRTSQRMCRISSAISTRSPATSFSARPASACFMARLQLLESMPPYQGGGDMIKSVTFEKTTYADLPNKFEAGTPHIEGGIGLGAAIDWVQSVGLEKMAAYEHDLLEYAQAKLAEVPGFRLIGSARNKASVISFVLDNPSFHPYDVGVALDMDGIAVRTGHHCCQPVMDRMHVSATARASLAAYNTREDIDALVASLKRLTVGSRPQQNAPAAPAVGAMASQEVIYPPAAGRTPQAAADELAEIFDLLGERDEKNRYVLDDLGAHLPHYFDLLKSVSERVQGCVSEVYLVGRRSKSDAQRAGICRRLRCQHRPRPDRVDAEALLRPACRSDSGVRHRRLLPANRPGSVHLATAPKWSGGDGESDSGAGAGDR